MGRVGVARRVEDAGFGIGEGVIDAIENASAHLHERRPGALDAPAFKSSFRNTKEFRSFGLRQKGRRGFGRFTLFSARRVFQGHKVHSITFGSYRLLAGDGEDMWRAL